MIRDDWAFLLQLKFVPIIAVLDPERQLEGVRRRI